MSALTCKAPRIHIFTVPHYESATGKFTRTYDVTLVISYLIGFSTERNFVCNSILWSEIIWCDFVRMRIYFLHDFVTQVKL